MLKSFLSLLMLAFLCSSAVAQNNGAREDATLVEIDGHKLTLADIQHESPAALFQAQNAFYTAERKAVDAFVDEYLLTQAAQKEGLTAAQLLDRHVNRLLPPDPSEEVLRVYYESVDTDQPFAAVRDKILDYVRQRRIEKAKSAYLHSLREHAQIAVRLSPPRVQLGLKDTPLRGRPDAPVVLVEYADYECPYCQQIQPVLDKLEKEYGGRIAFAYKDMPLPMHQHAQKAAEATRCAAVQGKYWEYHDTLAAKKQFDIASLKQDARSLQLDADRFDKCLDSGEQSGTIAKEVAEANSLGLQGTPSLFINGRFFNGVLSYEQLRAIIDEELSISSVLAQNTGASIVAR